MKKKSDAEGTTWEKEKPGNSSAVEETIRIMPLSHTERSRYKGVDRQVMKKVSVAKKSEESQCWGCA